MNNNLMKKYSNYENVPEEMKNLERWLKWKKVPNKDKGGNIRIDKVHYSIKNNSGYKWNSPNRWTDYERAKSNFKGFDGLGYVLTEEDNIVSIGLDSCFIDNKLKSLAERIVKYFDGSYMEYSQSGEGIHIFVKGKFPRNINLKNIGVEVYIKNRFIALTEDVGKGKDFKISNSLLDKQKELDQLWKELKPFVSEIENKPRESVIKNLRTPVNNSPLNKVPDIESILSTMFKTNNIASTLISGNSYTGDHSRDDFIFLLLAKNYSHGDPKLMEGLFLMTPLNRLGTGEKRKSDRESIWNI